MLIKKTIALALILALASCNISSEKGIDFKIINSSESTISEVKFLTTEKLEVVEFDEIEPNASATDFLPMKSNKTDGAYILEFTRVNGQRESRSSGYYTNGSPLEKWATFEIKADTVLAKFGAY